MANGKIEAAINLPAAGYSVTLTDVAAAAATVTIAGDGSRYLSSPGSLAAGLLAEFATQLTAIGDTYTVALNASGQAVITNTDTNSFTIVWDSTELRDLLGFTGTITGSAAQTSPDHAKALWLPDGPWNKELGNNWPGHERSNKSDSESIEGHVYSLSTGSKTELDSLLWDVICKEKTWAQAEVLTNESLQQLWRDSFGRGSAAWGRDGGPIRFHEDETDDGTYQTYYVPGFEMYKPTQRVTNQTGQWRIEFPRLVLVPS